jgi:TolB protein
MVPRLASAVVLPVLVSAVLLALVFSSAGSARVGAGSNGKTFPGQNGEIVFLGVRSPNTDLDLYLIGPNGTHQRRITSTPGLEMTPSWSPGGEWIAFVRGPKQLCPQIYLLRANGTGLRRITHDRACYESPTWSPDGTRILATRCNGSCKQFSLWTMNLHGTDLQRLTDGRTLDNSASWSPDGTTIAFVREDPSAIWLMDADGTNQRQLTHPYQLADTEEDEDSRPDWSPDGNLIAFSRLHEPHEGKTGSTRYRQDIYVIHPDGTGLQRLTRLTSDNVSPAWSPDGKRVAFASDRGRDDLYDIYVMNADGTKQTRFTKTADSDSPDWQPQH